MVWWFWFSLVSAYTPSLSLSLSLTLTLTHTYSHPHTLSLPGAIPGSYPSFITHQHTHIIHIKNAPDWCDLIGWLNNNTAKTPTVPSTHTHTHTERGMRQVRLNQPINPQPAPTNTGIRKKQNNTNLSKEWRMRGNWWGVDWYLVLVFYVWNSGISRPTDRPPAPPCRLPTFQLPTSLPSYFPFPLLSPLLLFCSLSPEKKEGVRERREKKDEDGVYIPKTSL